MEENINCVGKICLFYDKKHGRYEINDYFCSDQQYVYEYGSK